MKIVFARILKKVDKANKLFIPKSVIDSFGREFWMEIQDDKIILIPLKKG